MEKRTFVIIVIVNFLIVIWGIFLIIRINDFPNKIESLILAENISKAALQFNVENFHTQLEMWEYAYQPNNERLAAFELHNKALVLDSENFISSVNNNKGALYRDGDAHATKIISDLTQVQEDWKYLLNSIKEYQQLLESNASELEMLQAEKTMDSMVFRNEDLFDKLEFNKEVEYFTTSQSKYVDNLKKEIISNRNLYRNGIFSIIGLFIFGIIWYGLLISKRNKNIWQKRFKG